MHNAEVMCLVFLGPAYTLDGGAVGLSRVS